MGTKRTAECKIKGSPRAHNPLVSRSDKDPEKYFVWEVMHLNGHFNKPLITLFNFQSFHLFTLIKDKGPRSTQTITAKKKSWKKESESSVQSIALGDRYRCL